MQHGGISYGTVLIGSQCWLSENLNLGTMVDSLTNQTDNTTTEKYCYRNDSVNCVLYGGLYQWNEAMQYVTTPGTQGICPPGWHIPTEVEFQTLSTDVGNDGNALKAVGQGTGGGAGTNNSGFSALLAGHRYGSGGGFLGLGIFAYFWSSSENEATNAYYLPLSNGNGDVSLYYYYKTSGYSVRCLED